MFLLCLSCRLSFSRSLYWRSSASSSTAAGLNVRAALITRINLLLFEICFHIQRLTCFFSVSGWARSRQSFSAPLNPWFCSSRWQWSTQRIFSPSAAPLHRDLTKDRNKINEVKLFCLDLCWAVWTPARSECPDIKGAVHLFYTWSPVYVSWVTLLNQKQLYSVFCGDVICKEAYNTNLWCWVWTMSSFRRPVRV